MDLVMVMILIVKIKAVEHFFEIKCIRCQTFARISKTSIRPLRSGIVA